ncbi:MAG: GTPase [Clostridia bacterium]|nr:GTPase [Clostridia bacterium]
MAVEVPVYLFTGFLEAGKTKFIQETLEDERFAIKENTLLLVCEEGEEEYDPSTFSCDVSLEVIPDKDALDPTYLSKLVKKHKSARVMIEYNGMWMLPDLYEAMPEGWMIYQEIALADANTFGVYNQNMRTLTVDKLNSCEVIIFNRTPENVDKDTYHKIVRGVSRSCAISYVYPDGHIEYDETIDPLPFDTESNNVVIEDRDYALWYRDMTEEPQKYIGKTVTFKGVVAVDKRFPKNTFAIGRHVMICCENDITYRPVVAISPEAGNLKNREWVMVSAKFEFKRHELYESDGPVLTVTALVKSDPPEQEVATFY